MKESHRLLTIIAIILASLGILVFLIFIFFLIISDVTFGAPVDIGFTSMTGEFISGTVGVLWSGSATVLFYAALVYQRKTYLLTQESVNSQKFISVYFKLYESFSLSVIELEKTDYRPYLSESIELDDPGRGFSQLERHFTELITKLHENQNNYFTVSQFQLHDSRLEGNLHVYGEKFLQLLFFIDDYLIKSPGEELAYSFKNILIAERTEDQLKAAFLYAIKCNKPIKFLASISQFKELKNVRAISEYYHLFVYTN